MTNQSNADGDLLQPFERYLTLTILLIFGIPSLMAFSLLFYHFARFRRRLLVDRIEHQIIFLVLIDQCLLISTELPFTLSYLSLGSVGPVKICFFWIYWNSVLLTSSFFLLSFASIERYLSIFGEYVLRRHELLLHYLPILFIVLYTPIFYLVVLGWNLCLYRRELFLCGNSCLINEVWFRRYQWIVEGLLPCSILFVGNLFILFRTRRMRRSQSMRIWKKTRSSIRQLFLLSSVTFVSLLVIILDQPWIHRLRYSLPYVTTSMCPILVLIDLRETRRYFRRSQTPSPTIAVVLANNDLDEDTYF